MSNEKKKYMNTVLDVRLVEVTRKDEAGKEFKEKVPKLQLAKGVELFVNGQRLDLGKYNSSFLKRKKDLYTDINFLVEKEYITEDQAAKQVDDLDEYLKKTNVELTLKARF